MNSYIKTLETFNPFKSLKQEQANTDQVLDFRIIDFKLLCSKLKPAKTKSYERKDFHVFDSDDFFVKNYDTLTQKFIIEIHPKTQEETFLIHLKANASLTSLKAHIIFMDNFKYYPHLKFDILQNIYKTMIKQNFLILRLNEALFKTIDELVLSLEKNQNIKSLEILICKGVDKVEHKNNQIIYHKNIEHFNLSQAPSRAVKKNELLFEYIYKIPGQEGRNLRGELLHINPINFLKNPFAIKDESIYTQKLEDRIKYFSAKHGFLTKDDEGYSVVNELKPLKYSFDTTSKNLNILKLNDLNDDLNIKASDIKIDGNIGAIELYGKNISIKGLTHTQSKINAQNAYITTHQGSLKAHTAYIKNLKNANVVAKNVFVENCTASKIKAENIYICNLATNNALYPTKNLIITNHLEFKNTINVFPLSSIEDEADEGCEDIKNLYLQVENKLYETINKMQNYYDYLFKNQIKITKLQENKSQSTEGKYNQLNASYKRFTKLKDQVNNKLHFLGETIYKVKIYIQAEKIGGDNFLKFYPKSGAKLELKHKISPNDYNKTFYLKKGQYTDYIQATYNYPEDKVEELKALFEKLQKDNL